MLSTIDFAVITYDANWVISLIVAVLIIALGDFIIFKYVSRHPAFIPGLIAFEAAALLAFILPNFDILGIVGASGAILLIGGAIIINANNVRANMANGVFKKDFFKRKKVEPEMVFDRDDLYKAIYKAVIDMSMMKRGCLITFMKKDDLLDEDKIPSVVKQRGVDVNAPVTPEPSSMSAPLFMTAPSSSRKTKSPVPRSSLSRPPSLSLANTAPVTRLP